VDCIRVIDESGEDYLYPANRFVTVDFAKHVRARLPGGRTAIGTKAAPTTAKLSGPSVMPSEFDFAWMRAGVRGKYPNQFSIRLSTAVKDWSQIIELLWGHEEKLCVFSVPTTNLPQILREKSVCFDVEKLTASDQARLPAKWEKEQRLLMQHGFFQACAHPLKSERYFCRNERIAG